MFKPHNKQESAQQSKEIYKRRDEPIRTRRDFSTRSVSRTRQFYEKQMNQARMKSWEEYEITTPDRQLTKQDCQLRNQIAKYLFRQIRRDLGLTERTLQHTAKLLDIYEARRRPISDQSSSRENIYPQKSICTLDFMNCLHLAAKYNEIYPPALCQLTRYFGNRYQTRTIIQNQITILNTLDLDLNVALVSDWYKMINLKLMPKWAYYCFTFYGLQTRSKTIAQDITQFIQQVKNLSNQQTYILISNYDGQESEDVQQSKILNAFNQFKQKKYSKVKASSTSPSTSLSNLISEVSIGGSKFGNKQAGSRLKSQQSYK